MNRLVALLSAAAFVMFCATSFAGIESSISGVVNGSDGIGISGATVQLQSTDGKLVKET